MDESSRARRVLVIDDDEDACRLLAAQLGRLNVGCDWRTSAEAALALVGTRHYDAVLTDLNLAGLSGLDLALAVRERDAGLAVILVTAYGTAANAVAAMRAGVTDFLRKPISLDELARAVGRAVKRSGARRTLASLRERLAASSGCYEMIGTSPRMREVYELIERLSASDVTVFIRGESGTGKELVARALHGLGQRRAGPFVAINCAAIPETLLESELFGHERGAFTDAKLQRDGLLRRAHGGTVFLDEIGDMPVTIQVKLLRALQERVLRPVGSNVEVAFDAQIIAATHRDLEAAVRAGSFRQDLYYRLDVVRIDVPALRERGDDVLLLAQAFLERAAARQNKGVRGLSAAAAERILAYHWPGNVRELQNAVEHAVAISRYDLVLVDDLPERIVGVVEPALPPASVPLIPFEQVEREHIIGVLRALGGNKAAAARVLGLDRRTLYRKLALYEAAAQAGRAATPSSLDVDPSASAPAMPATVDVDGDAGESDASADETLGVPRVVAAAKAGAERAPLDTAELDAEAPASVDLGKIVLGTARDGEHAALEPAGAGERRNHA